MSDNSAPTTSTGLRAPTAGGFLDSAEGGAPPLSSRGGFGRGNPPVSVPTGETAGTGKRRSQAPPQSQHQQSSQNIGGSAGDVSGGLQSHQQSRSKGPYVPPHRSPAVPTGPAQTSAHSHSERSHGEFSESHGSRGGSGRGGRGPQQQQQFSGGRGRQSAASEGRRVVMVDEDHDDRPTRAKGPHHPQQSQHHQQQQYQHPPNQKSSSRAVQIVTESNTDLQAPPSPARKQSAGHSHPKQTQHQSAAPQHQQQATAHGSHTDGGRGSRGRGRGPPLQDHGPAPAPIGGRGGRGFGRGPHAIAFQGLKDIDPATGKYNPATVAVPQVRQGIVPGHKNADDDVRSVFSDLSTVSRSTTGIGASGNRREQLTREEAFEKGLEIFNHRVRGNRRPVGNASPGTGLLPGQPTTPGTPGATIGDDVSVSSHGSIMSQSTTATNATATLNANKEMFRYFQIAASRGHARAQIHLATLCLQSNIKGIFYDRDQAMTRLITAARQDNQRDALHLLIHQLLTPPPSNTMSSGGLVITPPTAASKTVESGQAAISTEEMKRLCNKFIEQQKDPVAKFYLAKLMADEAKNMVLAIKKSKLQDANAGQTKSSNPSRQEETLAALAIRAYELCEEVSFELGKTSTANVNRIGGNPTATTPMPRTPGGAPVVNTQALQSVEAMVQSAQQSISQHFDNCFVICCELAITHAQGHLPACWRLATIHSNSATRRKYYEECAKQGKAEAYLELALLARTEMEKLKAFVAAADAGLPEAWVRLRVGYSGDSNLQKHWSQEKINLLQLIKVTPELRASLNRSRSQGNNAVVGSPAANTTSPNPAEKEKTDCHETHKYCEICSQERKDWDGQTKLSELLDIHNSHKDASLFNFDMSAFEEVVEGTSKVAQSKSADDNNLGNGGEGQVLQAMLKIERTNRSGSTPNDEVKYTAVALKTLFKNDIKKARDEMNKLMLFSFSDYIPRCFGHTIFTPPYPPAMIPFFESVQTNHKKIQKNKKKTLDSMDSTVDDSADDEEGVSDVEDVSGETVGKKKISRLL